MTTQQHPFCNYAFPQPNMLVQSGTKVRIKNLTSESGLTLNGRLGKAVQFHPDRDERWSVQLLEDENENEEEADEEEEEADDKKIEKKKKVVSIRINNLEFADDDIVFCVITRDNPHWAIGSENGRHRIQAGTMGNKPALCLYEDPSPAGGFGPTPEIYEEIQWMGIPKPLIQSFCESIGKK